MNHFSLIPYMFQRHSRVLIEESKLKGRMKPKTKLLFFLFVPYGIPTVLGISKGNGNLVIPSANESFLLNRLDSPSVWLWESFF